MKILILNPNSDQHMTRRILENAERYAAGAFDVLCLENPDAPEFIETYEDQVRTAPGMIRMVREHETEVDAFIVACHCDPNLDVLKEISEKPVVGIGEASMKLASMLGHRFSVVSTARHSVPLKEALVRAYHLEGMLASVRAPSPEMSGASEMDRYRDAAVKAIEEDGAEVIVLGCAGMSGLDKQLQQELAVPVLDGVICALNIAVGLVRTGISTSKIRRYNPHPE
jgi:allantoin racemase